MVRTRRSAEARVQQLAAGLGYTSELSASLDPGDVIDRTLDAVVALPGVDAALIAVGETGDGARVTRAAGMTADEIERTLLQMPAHPDLRAIEVVYRYRLDDVNESSKLPRSALTVSLRAEGETIGSLAAVTRSTTGGLLGVGRDRARGARPPRRARDLERDPLHRGARAGRARLAHGPPQPAALLRVPRPRDRPRPALRALRLADRLRPRRLQADQRPDRASRRRRGARRGRGSRARRRPRDGHPVPGRRRRVRGDPPRGEPRGRRAPRRPHRARDPRRRRSTRSARSRSPPASPSSVPATPPPTCSSAPTTRSSARRAPARPDRRELSGPEARAAPVRRSAPAAAERRWKRAGSSSGPVPRRCRLTSKFRSNPGAYEMIRSRSGNSCSAARRSASRRSASRRSRSASTAQPRAAPPLQPLRLVPPSSSYSASALGLQAFELEVLARARPRLRDARPPAARPPAAPSLGARQPTARSRDAPPRGARPATARFRGVAPGVQACRFQAFSFTPNCFQPLGLATRRLCALGLRPFHCEPLLRFAIVSPASGVGPVRLRRLDRLDLRLVLVELGRHELERAGTHIGRLGSGEPVDERGQGVVTVIRGDPARQRDEWAAKAQGIPGLPRLVDRLPALAHEPLLECGQRRDRLGRCVRRTALTPAKGG